MATEDDPFCNAEIVNSESVYTNRYFFVLYNIRPTVPGHVLLIPKRHVEHITELDSEEMRYMHAALKAVIPVLLKEYDADDSSYNLIIQAGKYSGMSIRHLHMHIIPRNKTDRYQKRNNALYTDIERSRKGLGKTHVKEQIARLKSVFAKRGSTR
jgi:bis(5'-adenosyl)-triphosphatase